MESYSDELWESTFSSREWGRYPSESLIRFIARNYYNKPDRSQIKVLEVGCGPGANLWFLAREGFATYGVDGSISAVELAKNRLNSECVGWLGEVSVGDILNLNYPDGYFDAVIDVGAVCCNDFEKSKSIYREMSRVLKVRGKMYSRTFSCDCTGFGTGEKVGHNAWMVTEGPLLGHGYVRFTQYDEINELCEGFKVDSVGFLYEGIASGSVTREWVILGSKEAE